MPDFLIVLLDCPVTGEKACSYCVKDRLFPPKVGFLILTGDPGLHFNIGPKVPDDHIGVRHTIVTKEQGLVDIPKGLLIKVS